MGIVSGQVGDKNHASLLTTEVIQWIYNKLSQNTDCFNKELDEGGIHKGHDKPPNTKFRPTPTGKKTTGWTAADFSCYSACERVTTAGLNHHPFVIGILKDGRQLRFTTEDWDEIPGVEKLKPAEEPEEDEE